jgi:spermidine synthase
MSVETPRENREENPTSGIHPVDAGRALRGRLPVLLFLSGLAGLVFQVAWFREFRLVFGSSTAASAAVTAVFMGGLGVGSAVLGRRVDRSRSPLRFYAVQEASIAVAAALSPFLTDLASLAYVSVGGQSVLGLTGATLARLTLCAMVLGLPTFLMGGTLPAAAKAITRADDGHRRAIALLYGLNALGAVVGAAASTFWLLPQWGNRLTLWMACMVDVGVGIWAYRISRRVETGDAAAGADDSAGPRPAVRDKGRGDRHKKSEIVTAVRPAPLWFVYASSACVGFGFFVMELVWYRMLGPILGGTTYTFGLILAVALAGIGIGGAIYPIVFRRISPSLLALAVTCGLEAACMAAAYAWGDHLAIYAALLQQNSHTFAATILDWSLVTLIAVLPASLVAGVQYPLLIALCGQGNKDVGREVGLTAAWNTAGAILGCLAGGFGLLPLLTAVGAWRGMVGLLAVLAVAAIVMAPRSGAKRDWKLLAAICPSAVAAALLWATGPTAAWRHSGIGAGRCAPPERDANAFHDWINTRRRLMIWEAEGVEASVSLVASRSLSFFVNGKSDGNAVGDAGTQMMLGILPALLHPGPKTSLVVGLGTGETAGWLAEVPGMDRVDVVELEPAVNEMARRCADVNHDVLHHPKVRFIYNDAREVLLTSPDRYDIISSEPSNPYRAGIANLFTREFYRASCARLREDGLFVQWVQGYEISEQTLHTALATLHEVFPHVEVWQSLADDMLLICSRRPLVYPAAALRAKITARPFRQALAYGWRAVDLEGVLCRFVAGPALVDKMAAQEAGRINTDDLNRIEYDFARSLGKSIPFSILDVRAQAVACGAHRPTLDDAASVDWNRVDGHRQILCGLSEKVVLPEHPTAEQQARAEVVKHYWSVDASGAADMKGMIDAWEKAKYPPLFPTETAMLSLGYAHLGREKAREMAESLREFEPAEADALLAYLRFKQGRMQESAVHLERAYQRMQQEPWGFSHVLEMTFDIAPSVVRAVPAAAPRLLRLLRNPLAAYAFDAARQSAYLSVSEFVGPEAIEGAVQAYEPHVPWREDFLALRLRVYERSSNPLKVQARRDLEQFRACRTGP